jgi:hypothetical protein
MADDNNYQRLIGLTQSTNKISIVGLSIMTEQSASQAMNIFRHFMSNDDMHMIRLWRWRSYV